MAAAQVSHRDVGSCHTRLFQVDDGRRRGGERQTICAQRINNYVPRLSQEHRQVALRAAAGAAMVERSRI